jgi:hypothetical protein
VIGGRVSGDANSSIDMHRPIERFCVYKTAVQRPQSFGRLVHAPRRSGLKQRRRVVYSPIYFTTILTSLSGTTITLTTCFPSNSERILVSVMACFSSASRDVPNAT